MDHHTENLIAAELGTPLLDPPEEQPEPLLEPTVPDYRLPGELAHQLLTYLAGRPYGEVAWLMEEIGKIEQL